MAITKRHINDVLETVAHEGSPVLRVAPSQESAGGVPQAWATVLSSPNARTEVLRLWEPMAPRFRRTLKIMKRSLQGIGLLTTDTRQPSLIYFFTLDDKQPFFYRGFLPATKLPKEAKSLPDEFIRFYQLHDGWIDQLGSMGPLPSREWEFLGREFERPAGKFLVVFHGNAGDRLGYDLDESPPLCYVVSSAEPPVRVVPKLWAEIDEWVSIQLEDMLPYTSK